MNVSARLRIVVLGVLFFAGPLFAQMGDTRDKAGMVQKPPPAEWVRPAPQLSPEDSLKTFTLPPGFRIELVAAEPLIHEPVALDFDPEGRLWVIEMRSYMPDVDGKGEDVPRNDVVILEDTNGDGRMDKRTVYMEGLGLARAVKVLRNGVLIGDPPNLWFTRDTDGDGKMDEKKAIATDFSVRERNPEEGANALIWGLDNWLEGSSYGRRLRFREGNWISTPVTVRGQWGQSMDDYGRLFTNSNEDYLRADLIPNYYTARNPNLALTSRSRRAATGVNYQVDADETVWPIRPTPGVNRGYWESRLRADGSLQKFDAACGPCIYRGDNFPAEFQGNYFNGEPAGHVVRRSVLTDKDGVLSARNAYERTEFLRSTDERFRPVNVYTAPDGTLYVVDLHRGILQHRQYMTSYLRRQILERGLDKGLGDGRIYRIVHEAKKPGPAPALSRASTTKLVETLSHPNGWWRDTAQRLLVEGGDKSAAPKLREMVLSGETDVPVRLKALWTLEGLGAIEPEMIARVMEDGSPKMRLNALRLSEPFLAAKHPALTEQALRHATDSSPEVRRQLMLSLGEAPLSVRTAPLAGMLREAVDEPFVISSVLSGLAGNELAFFEHLLAAREWSELRPGLADVLQSVVGAIVYGGKSEPLNRLLQIAQGDSAAKWQRLAILNGLRASSLRTVDAMPAALDRAAKSSEKEVASAAAELKERLVWPGKFGSEAPPLTAAEKQLFEKGREAFTTICAACHQPDGRGREGVAASLVDSPWVLGPDQYLARIVLKGKTGKTNVTMPPLEMLGNDTLASALTYIRRSWGHNAAPVSPATISSWREAIILRSQPYTEAELADLRDKNGAAPVK
jgi:mono/diheme cytochrome c family protein/glucose/arabinose dehydrogenase